MRSSRRFRLSRRALLRGASYGLALPWLEAMTPTRAAAQASLTPTRVLFVYFPSGYPPGQWLENGKPGARDVVLPPLAQALAPFKKKLTIITGLANAPAGKFGTNAGGIHARGTGCSLVCQPLTETGFDGDGVSVDQVLVRALAARSCISSLVLGLPHERTPSFSEEGYGSIFYNNVSFTGPRAPAPKVSDPSDLFLRLVTCPGFGGATDGRRARFEKSVMGAVKRQAEQLMNQAGRADRLRLEEYFGAVAELERRFLPAPPAVAPRPPVAPPSPANTLAEAAKAMIDLAVQAFATDLTRVGTLMMDGAFSRRAFGLPELRGANYVHGLSHGEIGGEEVDRPRWTRITSHYFELFAHLLGRLEAVRDGERTLLDNTLVVIHSEFGDGNSHAVSEQPFIVAGGGGRLRMGRHISVPAGTPQANALVDVLHAMDVARPAFGDSTGRIPGLAL